MDEVYKRACTEVIEALKYIPLEEYKKIPKKVLESIKENSNKDYKYTYDVKNPKMSKLANVIITKLYLDYIANEREKKLISEILELNSKKKKSIYNSNEMFNNSNENKIENSNIIAKNAFPAKTKNINWIKKFINKIKSIFVKRKSGI